MPFRKLKRWISPKNDEHPMESCSLTHFELKSFINLRDSKLQHKKKKSTETKIFIKCHLGGRNDGIQPKNNDSLVESFSLTYFESKSCTNLPESEFWRKKKRTTETKIFQKIPFWRSKQWNWPKNDQSQMESFPLTNF